MSIPIIFLTSKDEEVDEATDEEVDEASDEEVDEASDEEVDEAADEDTDESTKSEASLDYSRNVTTALREYCDFREGVRSTQFAGCFASLQDNELSYLTLK